MSYVLVFMVVVSFLILIAPVVFPRLAAYLAARDTEWQLGEKHRYETGEEWDLSHDPAGPVRGRFISITELRAATDEAWRATIPPLVVLTEDEAEEFTRDDPAGHRWEVGEEYYLVPLHTSHDWTYRKDREGGLACSE